MILARMVNKSAASGTGQKSAVPPVADVVAAISGRAAWTGSDTG